MRVLRIIWAVILGIIRLVAFIPLSLLGECFICNGCGQTRWFEQPYTPKYGDITWGGKWCKYCAINKSLETQQVLERRERERRYG